MKTIEEKVLAECERLCPEMNTRADLYEGAYIRLDLDGYSIYHYWGADRGNSTCVCSISRNNRIATNPTAYAAFYRLLGLESVELEARNAALVKALGEIKTICVEVRENPDYTFNGNEGEMFERICTRAIEANGKEQNG